MIKKAILILFVFCCFSCDQLQQVVNNLPQQGVPLTQADIANGLKQALNKGITEEVSKLAKENGFYKNQLVKIGLPEDLQKVADGLRKIGLGSLVDDGVKALNRAAEDAVGRATPIFVNAIKEMTFSDAKSILLGNDHAATTYLESKTDQKLYNEFHPEIQQSFAKVGADQIWSNLITKYNRIPFADNINPDLTDYVTKQALDGVYTMIAKEEKKIRTNIGSRTTKLLQRVFALQD